MPDIKPPAWAMKAAEIVMSMAWKCKWPSTRKDAIAQIIAGACPAGKLADALRGYQIQHIEDCPCALCYDARAALAEWEPSR